VAEHQAGVGPGQHRGGRAEPVGHGGLGGGPGQGAGQLEQLGGDQATPVGVLEGRGRVQGGRGQAGVSLQQPPLPGQEAQAGRVLGQDAAVAAPGGGDLGDQPARVLGDPALQELAAGGGGLGGREAVGMDHRVVPLLEPDGQQHPLGVDGGGAAGGQGVEQRAKVAGGDQVGHGLLERPELGREQGVVVLQGGHAAAVVGPSQAAPVRPAQPELARRAAPGPAGSMVDGGRGQAEQGRDLAEDAGAEVAVQRVRGMAVGQAHGDAGVLAADLHRLDRLHGRELGRRPAGVAVHGLDRAQGPDHDPAGPADALGDHRGADPPGRVAVPEHGHGRLEQGQPLGVAAPAALVLELGHRPPLTGARQQRGHGRLAAALAHVRDHQAGRDPAHLPDVHPCWIDRRPADLSL
jgi:hypothetical protein